MGGSSSSDGGTGSGICREVLDTEEVAVVACEQIYRYGVSHMQYFSSRILDNEKIAVLAVRYTSPSWGGLEEVRKHFSDRVMNTPEVLQEIHLYRNRR